ncbi:MAG: helix-turn-helix domain-containing protein [Mediterraneibacter gnavus]
MYTPIHIDAYSNCNVAMLESLTSATQHACARNRQSPLDTAGSSKSTSIKIHSSIIRKVVAYLETDLSADLTLNHAGTVILVSMQVICPSLFSKEMGTSLTDYVNHYRIEHAQTLLANTDVPIKDIALRCGIGDVHLLYRDLFKKISGSDSKSMEGICLRSAQRDRKNIDSK